MKRIGFDIDGVFANFTAGYAPRLVERAQEDLFPGGLRAFLAGDREHWDYDRQSGYTDAEIRSVWQDITRDKTFWYALPEIEEAMTVLRAVWKDLNTKHEVYFVTARMGACVKLQTQAWFSTHGLHGATVLISPYKGRVADALDLDAYIDDRWENIRDVVQQSTRTQAALLDQPYNRRVTLDEGYTRVPSVAAFLLHLNL